jgi:hypothetical protein
MQQVLNGVDKFTANDLYNLNNLLSLPKTLARTPGSDPLDSDHIKGFLENNFKIVVSGTPDRHDAPVSFAVFPLMSECTINSVKDGTVVNSIDFSKQTPRDQTYEDLLGRYLDSIKFRPDSSQSTLASRQTRSSAIPMVEILFQDFFDGLVKAAIHQVYETVRTSGAATTGLTMKEILAANPSYAHVVGQLNRFHKGGLRIPDSFAASGNPGPLKALYDLTGQQNLFNLPSTYAGTYQLQFNANTGVSWFTQVPVSNPAGPVAELIDSAIQNIEQAFPTLRPDASDYPLPALLPHNRTFAFEHCLNLDNKCRIWLMPDEMRADLTGIQPPGFTVELKQRSTNDPTADATDVDGKEIPYANFDTRWATVVNLAIRKIRDVTTPDAYYKDVYELLGTDDESRARLTELLGDSFSGLLSTSKVSLLRRSDRSDISVLTDDNFGHNMIGIAKVNLSTESFPGRNLRGLHDAGTYENVVRADLRDVSGPAAFITLIVQSSIVNAGGFYLKYPNLPDFLFDGMAGAPHTARLTFLIVCGALPANMGAHGYNAVILQNGSGAPDPNPGSAETGSVFYAETPGRYAYAPSTKAGHFSFAVRRTSPQYNYLLPSGSRGTRDDLQAAVRDKEFRAGTVL